MVWSPSTADELTSTFIVCIVATVVHTLFWIAILGFPSLKQRTMLWLYDYLLCDLLLLIRFFLLYGMRREQLCLNPTFRTVLCYYEASSKFYMNTVQAYLLLALTASRYLQIVYNRNVYIENVRSIIISHILIFVLPAVNVAVQFLAGWTLLWRRTGSSCDIQYVSIYVQIFNLFTIYIIPITTNLLLLTLCIRHASSTRGVQSEQIIILRRKHQRTLLYPTVAFYSIWLALWSPYVLAFQFININSDSGTYTSLMNYVEIAVDPVLIAILDVRFLKTWQTVWQRIRGPRQDIIAPVAQKIKMNV
ncbi:unnamed protein product [Adineta ricciae]|uniref:G-protein coupled receptors family 1 profile domain-containing protein n=1 Tax=Adineta ricciae TaxID=249248 RepID=A0A813XK05_ADIRI|nr:unnamed protein product [Adineta ricciae]